MDTIRKIICLILLVALLPALPAHSGAAGEPDGQLKNMLGFLIEAGALKGYETIALTESVSKAEFLAAVLRLMGYGDLSKSGGGGVVFADVPSNHWANAAIHYGYSLGLVSGDGDLRFYPENPVTGMEALKIAVCALGYGLQAEDRGGYPAGYMAVGRELRLIFDAPRGDGEFLWGHGVELLYRMAHADLMEKIRYGNSDTYRVAKSETLLSKNFGIYKSRGKFTADYFTAIHKDSAALKEDQITIDGVVYHKTDIDTSGIYGSTVDFYYRHDPASGEKTVFSITESGKTERLTIPAGDTIRAEGFGSRQARPAIAYYDQNGRGVRAVVSVNADIIYNGSYYGKAHEAANDMFSFPEGELTLVDVDLTGEYGLVFIRSYVYYFVHDVILEDGRITDVHGKNDLILKRENSRFKYQIVKEGRRIQLQDISRYDVAAISADNRELGNADRVLIEIFSKPFKGLITRISGEDITVDDKTYQRFETVGGLKPHHAPGDYGIFYLGFDDRIVAARIEPGSQLKYGYLLDASLDKGLSPKGKVKLLTEDNTLSVFGLSDKTRVNGGSKGMTAREILLSEKLTENDGARITAVKQQLVKYMLNEQGDISQLHIAGEGYDPERFMKNDEGKRVVLSNWYAGYSYRISAQTLAFVIVGEDERDYKVEKLSKYNSSYIVPVIYDADEERITKAVVLKHLYSTALVNLASNKIALVDKVTDAVNAEGELVHRLHAIYNGALIAKNARSNTILLNPADGQKLKRGTVIQFSVNEKDEIDMIELLFHDIAAVSASALPIVRGTENEVWSDLSSSGVESVISNRQTLLHNPPRYLIYGTVAEKVKSSVMVSVNGGQYRPVPYVNIQTYLYDAGEDSVKIVDSGSFVKGDRILVQLTKNEVRTILVMK